MAFNRPTLQTLINRARSDIETRLSGVDALLRRSFERAVAYMSAGLAHGLHGHIVYTSKQLLPDTAGIEGVRRWGSIFDVAENDPSFSTGNVDFTGTGTTLLPEGTEFQDADGNIFLVDSDVNLVGGAITTSVTAKVSGNYNLESGQPLTIVTPVAGIDSDATVAGDGLTGGAGAETADSYRSRILDRLRDPPSGGGPGDYRQVMLAQSGVTRAWERTSGLSLGYVALYFAVDGEASPIPSAPQVANVQAAIDEFAPISSNVTVYAPTESELDFTIALTPDTAAVRAAVEAELDAYLLREASPLGVTLELSQLSEAISLATGEESHVLTSPASDVVVPLGTLTTRGTMTYT